MKSGQEVSEGLDNVPGSPVLFFLQIRTQQCDIFLKTNFKKIFRCTSTLSLIYSKDDLDIFIISVSKWIFNKHNSHKLTNNCSCLLL